MLFALPFACSAAPLCSGHLAALVLQFALGIMVMCSVNYYHGEAMMMSFHVSVCKCAGGALCTFVPPRSRALTPEHGHFPAVQDADVSHGVATDFPPPHQHQADSETQATLKSRSSLSGRGAVLVSLLAEETWDICSLSRFFILFFWQNLPFCLLNIKH